MRIGLVAIIMTAMVIGLSSCGEQSVYSEYRDVDRLGWELDSALHYDVVVEDTSLTYDMTLHVRHTTDYPFQNLWLMLRYDTTSVDTFEIYLADQRGKWFGAKRGTNYELSVDYHKNIRLPHSTHIDIVHGMRVEALNGVTAVGIELREHGQE